MTWAHPTWGFASLVVAAFALLAVLSTRRHHARLAAAFGDRLAGQILPDPVRRRRRVAVAFAVLGLLLGVVALMGPQGPPTRRTLSAEGLDLVVVLDLSLSMEAQDVDPSRLERARREVLDLLDRLEGDRIGVVVFAASAWPRLPLTQDHRAVRMVLETLDTRTFQAQGSHFAPALTLAADLLERNPDQAGRAVLVVSDGEAHDPEALPEVQQRLADAGIAVYGMVIGREPSPIPNPDGGFVLDPVTQAKVLTAPSDAVLAELAQATGGAVLSSVASAADTDALLTQLRTTLATTQRAQARRDDAPSWHGVPLTLSALLLFAAAWWGDGRGVRTIVAAWIAIASLVVTSPAHAGPLHDADAAYRAGRYPEAVTLLEGLVQATPDDADLLHRLAAARYRAGDVAGAARAWARQAELTGDADAWYNAGNADWQAGNLDRAARRYDAALARDPEHEGATANRQALQQEITRRRAPPPPSPGGQGQDQGDPKSDPNAPAEQGAAAPNAPPPNGSDEGAGAAPATTNDAPTSPEAPKPGEVAPPPQQGSNDQGQTGSAGPTTADSPTADPTALDGAGAGSAPDPDGGPTDPSQAGSGITPAEAKARLDSVEEGNPRLSIPGRRTNKPW
jgi:Ca-activated chloride channel family protein